VEDEGYVEGLTGEEIINDVLDLIHSKLRSDCSLRETDAYTGGYDGTIDIKLNLHGLDTENVHARITIGKAVEDPEAKKVDTQVEIPLEPRLNVVRERSGQDVPTLSKDDEGRVVVKKRHYAKKAYGGATGEDL
jgi:hypothetical protein